MLGVVAAIAMLLAGTADASFDLGAGGERVASPISEQARERAEKQGRAAARERSLAQARPEAGAAEPSADDPCARNMEIAASKGLRLPEGWELHCPGPGLDWEGGTHWGVTCRYADCPEGPGPYISISNPAYYVVAHELCHANFGDDEAMADSCAAEHGASLAMSPYQ